MKILIESKKYPYSIGEETYRAIICTKKNFINFLFTIDYWSINNYKKQWYEGIKRIQEHNSSCLIIDIIDVKNISQKEWMDKNGPTPVIAVLTLYKKNQTIIMQKLLFSGGLYKKYINKKELSLENIYDLIPPYQQFYPIFFSAQEHEWITKLNTVDQDIQVQIINKTPQKEFGQSDDNNVIRTKIIVNNYTQKYKTPIDDWSVKMYQQQWQSGLERIKTHDSSCLIMRIDQREYPMMSWWLLYKKGDTIFIYNDYLLEDEFEELGIHHKLTPENCYDSIPSHEQQKEKYRIKEWTADIADVQNLTIETVDPDDMPVKDSLKDLIEKNN